MIQIRNVVNATAQQLLPQCVKTCAQQVQQTHPCSPSEPCYCDSTSGFGAAQVACLKSSCTLDDQLAARRVQADTCGLPVHDTVAEFRGVVYTLFGIALLFTIARLLSRWTRLRGPGLWWDDFVIFVAVGPMIGIMIDSTFATRYGLGKDMWALTANDLVHFLQWFWIAEPLYIVGTRLTKISLLLLYLRIWKEDTRSPFTIACWITGILLACSIIGAIFATAFQCSPVKYYWEHVLPTARGICIIQTALSIGNAATVIFFDVVVLLLPVPKLMKLKVSLMKRAGICAVILVGFVVTACSIVRITYVERYSRTSMNITYDYRGLALWSHIEVYLSMVCCSMPQMPGLMRRIALFYKGDLHTTRLDSDGSADAQEVVSKLDPEAVVETLHEGGSSSEKQDAPHAIHVTRPLGKK